MKNSKWFTIMLSFFTVQIFAQNQQSFSSVEVSFVFTRQIGAASNQYAVWIEDASGAVIKTLYATRYTAKGGWKIRDQSIPLWVKKANVSVMNTSEIDAFTSATPGTGTITYIWDGSDKSGKKVSPGEYHVFLEASLRWGGRVVYDARIRNDTRGVLRVDEHYYDGNTELSGSKIPAEKKMISNVMVTIR